MIPAFPPNNLPSTLRRKSGGFIWNRANNVLVCWEGYKYIGGNSEMTSRIKFNGPKSVAGIPHRSKTCALQSLNETAPELTY